MTTKGQETTERKPGMKYVTIVFKYFDKGRKNTWEVTDFITEILEQARAHNNNNNYDDIKFDLYGVCVEEDTEIAEAKNGFIKKIDE